MSPVVPRSVSPDDDAEAEVEERPTIVADSFPAQPWDKQTIKGAEQLFPDLVQFWRMLGNAAERMVEAGKPIDRAPFDARANEFEVALDELRDPHITGCRVCGTLLKLRTGKLEPFTVYFCNEDHEAAWLHDRTIPWPHNADR